MMSSATSTDATPFRSWHFFVLAGLVAATVAVVVVRPADPAALVLLVAAVGSGAYVGFAVYRMILPLTARDFTDRTEMIAGRTRAALDRDKTLVLRAIKELEFDRAMGKISNADFDEMGGRLRARARTLLKQLDVDGAGYRDLIERELAERLEQSGMDRTRAAAAVATESRRACAGCGTSNDVDAKFCKNCGTAL